MTVFHNTLTGTELHNPLGHGDAGVLVLPTSDADAYNISDTTPDNIIKIDTTLDRLTLGGPLPTYTTALRQNFLIMHDDASDDTFDQGLIFSTGVITDNRVFFWDNSAQEFVLASTTGIGSQNITTVDRQNLRVRDLFSERYIRTEGNLTDTYVNGASATADVGAIFLTPGTNKGVIFDASEGEFHFIRTNENATTAGENPTIIQSEAVRALYYRSTDLVSDPSDVAGHGVAYFKSGEYFVRKPGGVVQQLSGTIGEANTASNVNVGGVGVFEQKTGVDLEFRGINAASSRISVALDGANNEIDIDVTEANLDLANMGGTLANDAAHGARGGGTQHALAVAGAPGTPGFISGPDQAKLDSVITTDIRDQIVWDHFQSSNADSDEAGWMGWRYTGSGAGNSFNFAAAIAGHPGIVQVNNGSAGTGRAALHLGDDSGTGGRIILGGTNDLICEVLARFPAAADFSGTNLAMVMIGLGYNWADNAEITDGVYFRYAPGTDTEWSIVTANGGTRTVVSLGTAPVAGNWVRLGFRAGASSVQGVFNGTDQGAALTTNLPTTAMGFGVKSQSAGGVNATIQLDYVSLTQVTDKET